MVMLEMLPAIAYAEDKGELMEFIAEGKKVAI